MKYDKLVRDGIPDHIRGKGGQPVFHVAEDGEYWQKLKEKLIEEFCEFEEDESIGEFADMMEVVDAIAEYKGFDPEEVKRAREGKKKEKGGFKERIILDEA